MEKFYIVTNADFLNEIKDYNVHDEERRKLINEFFDEKRIAIARHGFDTVRKKHTYNTRLKEIFRL